MNLNIDKNFPCKLCNHPARAHFTSIVERGLEDICGYCMANAIESFYDALERNKFISLAVHNFDGDNLKYLEDKHDY
jgi:hypothetical protein